MDLKSVRRSIWNNPETRESVLNGVIARGPHGLLWMAGAVGGLSVYLLFNLATRFALCVFGAGLSIPCGGIVELTVANLAIAGGSVLLGVVYGYVFRHSIETGRFVVVEPFNQVTTAHGLALVAGWLVGYLVVLHRVGTVAGLLALLVFLSGPTTLGVWGWARQRVGALYMRSRPIDAIALGISQLVIERVRLHGSKKLKCSLTDHHFRLEGPLDYIDAARAEDLILTSFEPAVRKVEVVTTLDEEDYWKYKFAELGPSGYVSPPIPEPMVLPTWLLVGGILICIGIMAGLFYVGGVLTLDKLAAQVEDAMGGMGLR